MKMKGRAILLLVLIYLAIFLVGCGKVDNLKQSVDEKVSVITGKETVSDEEKAKEVAKNFAKDLLTFKGKTEENYYKGGLQYVHPEIRDSLAEALKNDYFQPFDEMVKYFGGKENLPEVSEVVVDSVTESEETIEDKPHKMYRMDLSVRFVGPDSDVEKLSVNVTNVNNTWMITGIELK